MSHLIRSVLLTILTSVGFAYGSPAAAQPITVKAQVPAHASIDGKFVRYLESPNHGIDGIMLEDGTVARFAATKRARRCGPLVPGDSVHVEGDVVGGLPGPYLVHALVSRSSLLATRGDSPPPSQAGSASGASRSHRAVKHGKSTPKEDPPVQRRRLETIESKVREATTGKPKNGNYSQWSRVQETDGP
jgi:hypothetical protein